MIDFNEAKRYCSEDISLIENYSLAMTDSQQVWHCHHKLGPHKDYCNTSKELKKMGLYYHRPACELIFLTEEQHREAHKWNSMGERNGMYGTHKTKEEKDNLSKKITGIKRSTETKDKMSKARTGKAYSEFAIKYKAHFGYGSNVNRRQYDTEKHYFYRNHRCRWEE